MIKTAFLIFSVFYPFQRLLHVVAVDNDKKFVAKSNCGEAMKGLFAYERAIYLRYYYIIVDFARYRHEPRKLTLWQRSTISNIDPNFEDLTE